MENTLKLFLLKLQSVAGTPEAALVAGDLAEVDPASGIESDTQVAEIDLVGGGYTQDKAVVGRKKANVNLNFPIREEQAGHTPKLVEALQCARFAVTESAGYFVLTPSNTTTDDCTVWEYSGDLGASLSLVHKAGNIKFNGKLSFDFSGDSYGKCELNGVGLEVAAPIVGTQPTVTKDNSVVNALLGVTCSINGDSDYEPLSLEIDFGQEVENKTLASDATGCGESAITKRKIKFTTKVYRQIPATTDPIAALYATTEGVLNLAYGASDIMKVECNNAQITSVKKDEDAGIETYTIEGQINQNDLTISITGSST